MDGWFSLVHNKQDSNSAPPSAIVEAAAVVLASAQHCWASTIYLIYTPNVLSPEHCMATDGLRYQAPGMLLWARHKRT